MKPFGNSKKERFLDDLSKLPSIEDPMNNLTIEPLAETMNFFQK